jgi:phosphoribosylanthranilate isomerase
MPLKIKVCCISSLAEAQSATDAGADILGLVAHMPSGPGVISDELIAQIARHFSHSTKTFLLTSETSAAAIIKQQQMAQTTSIQLVDTLSQGQYQDIRTALPDVELIQVIHVIDEAAIEEALAAAEQVDFLLLDSGNPKLAVKELGGTGRTHNWAISRQIVNQSPIPVFLAGGLHTGNVRAAIDQVQPYGLDLCSGVRTNDRLDLTKLQDFMQAVRQ